MVVISEACQSRTESEKVKEIEENARAEQNTILGGY